MNFIRSILTLLQLSRAALVFTAISNAWLIVYLSKDSTHDVRQTTEAIAIYSMGELLLISGVIAIGMYLFGMVSNDLFDAKRDKSFAPERPIPSGKISTGYTAAIAGVTLFISITTSTLLGWHSIVVSIFCALMIIFYNTAGKHLPAVGVITLGLIRAAHMLIVNPLLGFCWPVWFTLTHILFISTICHRLEDKRPKMDGKEIITVLAGWAFLSMLFIVWMSFRETLVNHEWSWIWLGPIVSSIGFMVVFVYTWKQATSGANAGGLIMKRGLIWLIIHDASWMFAMQKWNAGFCLLSMVPAIYITIYVTKFLKSISTPTEFEMNHTNQH